VHRPQIGRHLPESIDSEHLTDGPRPWKASDLDRRSASSWIAVAALAVLVTLLGACAAPADGSTSSESALANASRWTLPSDVAEAGAKVSLPYDDAPLWTGAAACSGELKPGGHVLGRYLRDRFTSVSSVGGYACRRNTADTARLSVHGTGRALDVFIPKIGKAPDDAQGDHVANWLVMHAQEIGVQLIIWDRSIWRANGTNASLYGGPVAHEDHLHVELTVSAAAHTALWFTESGASAGSTGSGDPTADPTTTAPGAGGGDPTTTEPDGGSGDPTTTAPDAGATTTEPDAGAAPPAAPDASSPATPPSGAGAGPLTGTPSDGLESAGDAPGETNSLGSAPRAPPRASWSDAAAQPSAGCSAAPRGAGGGPARGLAGALALVLGAASLLRRARRRASRS
jgi:hypothetical protein